MNKHRKTEYLLFGLIGITVVLLVLVAFYGVADEQPLNDRAPVTDLDEQQQAALPDDDSIGEVGDGRSDEASDNANENEPDIAPTDEAQSYPISTLAQAQQYINDSIYAAQSFSCTKNGILYKIPNDDKKIALTFDDGPVGAMTDKYLAVLDEYDVKATFFMLGQYIEKYPEQANNIVAAGHEAASHSWYHHNLPKYDEDFIKEDFAKTQAAFQDTLGVVPALFRPPYGATDDNVFAAAKGYGMLYVMWSYDPRDYESDDAKALAAKVINNVTSGTVILMHENKKTTLSALPTIISSLQEQGYEFVTLSELVYSTEAEKAQAETVD